MCKEEITPMSTKKLINSESTEEGENISGANLRIISQETVVQKALRIVPPIRGQTQL